MGGLRRRGVFVVDGCPMCGGQLVDDGKHQDCTDCDYSAPTESHDLSPRLSLERESVEHLSLKLLASRWLKKRGFAVEQEYGCRLSRAIKLRSDRRAQKYIVVDVAGLKRGRAWIAVECGDCTRPKLEALICGFKEVWWWPHGKSSPERIRSSRRFKSLRFEYGVQVPNH